ncbi:DsbA family oxidoreductase [Lederbergia graminis]|uniref:DsbA family protein n=1 Tax=Lederbergia graminis TaxID=735518 RepID=A0ABW0LJZ3_9BACI
MMSNNLICDLETGICGVPGEEELEVVDFNQPAKTIDLYYVTDPICSHCWALEPTLRRLKEEYGQYFNFHTVMGGLLEKWGGGPVDPGNGIFGPADVAGHWREVGEYSRMPIDGSVMVHDPVQSSFPPSRVYKVIQQQHGAEKADEFLRQAREALFAFNQNISADAKLIELVNEIGLDGEKIVKEAEGELGQQLLMEDFVLKSKLGVRGFPTIVMVNEDNKGVKVVGSRPLDFYVSALKQVSDKEELKANKLPALSELLAKEKLLFAKEIEVMYDLEKADLDGFIAEQLPAGTFEENELLGEKYFVSK